VTPFSHNQNILFIHKNYTYATRDYPVVLYNLVKQRLRFMKYAVEIGSSGMIYIPSFMDMGTGVQTVLIF
jgi:hypothetical protein